MKRRPRESLGAGEDTEAAAFEALVHRQSRFVFRVVYALLRSEADAEDVTQEAFLKLHRNGAWKQMQDERAFLARTAWRLALDRKRSQAAQGVRVEAEPFDTWRGNLPSPEQAAMDGDALGLVHRLMDALPEELRQPLALSAIEELNSREIAELLHVKEGTVRTRLMRARAMLRELLKEQLSTQMGGRHERA